MKLRATWRQVPNPQVRVQVQVLNPQVRVQAQVPIVQVPYKYKVGYKVQVYCVGLTNKNQIQINKSRN